MKRLHFSTLLIAILVAAVSITGILLQDSLYPTDEVLNSFLPSDYVNLVAGLPFLVISLWFSRKGKVMGMLCLPGALFYLVYVYFPYLVSVPFNLLFLPYLVVFALSIYTLIGVVSVMDPEPIRQRFSGNLPERAFGGILIGLAAIIVIRQVVLIIGALINNTAVDQMEVALWIIDFSVGAPAMLLAGILLWKKKPLGYVAAPGLFMAYGILSLGLIPFMMVQSNLGGAEVRVADVLVLILMAALCFIPFAFFVRASVKTRDVG